MGGGREGWVGVGDKGLFGSNCPPYREPYTFTDECVSEEAGLSVLQSASSLKWSVL